MGGAPTRGGPTVTAIVPTFNRAGLIGEALEAVLAQTEPPQQVIVLDDGSTDDTAEVVGRFGSRVEYRRQDNAGKAAALNRALLHATGDAIWVMDDDDIADPSALHHLRAALRRRPDAGFSFGLYDNFTDVDGARSIIPVLWERCDEEDAFWSLMIGRFVFQPSMLVRKSAYDEVGPFDETLLRAQDFDMLLRLAGRFPVASVDEIVFHQRQHAGTRGTAAHTISGAQVWNQQHTWNARVMEKSFRESDLESYLPSHARGSDLAPQRRAQALVRRCASMCRWGLWREAARDLAEAASIAAASDPRGARELAAPFTSALSDDAVFDDVGPRNELVRQAHGLDGALGREMRAALFWPLVRMTSRALRSGSVGGGLRHAATYMRLTRGRTLAAHLGLVLRKARG